MKWPVETIDVVAQVNPKLAAADRPDLHEIVCFVPMAAVSEETQSIEAQAERPFSEVAMGYTPFKRGDVLVAKITPCFENGKMALADNLAHEFGLGTTEFHVFRPSERITGPYLFNLLRAPHVRKAGAMRMKGAAGQRRVPADFFAALQIPLPPLAEQKRIAEILDKADALRAKRRAALAQLDTLTQSIFLDMFGDPATNPNEMCKLPLGDVIKLKSGEFLPATEMVERGPYSVLGGNGINGFHDRYMFDDPQIVIGRVGVYCGCVHASPPKSWVTDNALYVSEWSPRLRFEYLLHALTHARLNQYASQSGQPLVSGSRIYPVAIVVPPEELQIAFEVHIASTGKLKRLYDAAISEVDVLFAALQHRAFQGGL